GDGHHGQGVSCSEVANIVLKGQRHYFSHQLSERRGRNTRPEAEHPFSKFQPLRQASPPSLSFFVPVSSSTSSASTASRSVWVYSTLSQNISVLGQISKKASLILRSSFQKKKISRRLSAVFSLRR